MKKQLLPILAIIAFSSIIRLFALDSIPAGLSYNEVNLGLSLSSVFGDWILSPFLIRLPFATIGILSIVVFYLLIKKALFDNKLAIIASLLMSVLPWHVQESRTFSLGTIIFLLIECAFLLFLSVFKDVSITKNKIIVAVIFLGLASIFIPTKNLAIKVNDQRLLVSSNSPKILSKIFINKITENYKQKEKIMFSSFDFGNYFFVGHPRERVGLEETQKLFIFMLPLLLIGIFKIKDEKNILLLWTVLSLFLILLFEWQGSETLLLSFPLVVLTSCGLISLFGQKDKTYKYILFLITVFALFESTYFYNSYFSGLVNSQYTSRRPIYTLITSDINKIRESGDTVLVNDRLGNPKNYFNFYLKKKLSGFEFRTYDYHSEFGEGVIFVDVLPDDPSSKEPLYTKD
ncbi:MAG: phospholipid carrier-dependent glycosyltransferase, partial [Bacteroidales bacterium]|nr:phospholipid carrier-dependent glycosyltransferase [Bacteroidales bacterium]